VGIFSVCVPQVEVDVTDNTQGDSREGGEGLREGGREGGREHGKKGI
jgi:hypothetical protein